MRRAEEFLCLGVRDRHRIAVARLLEETVDEDAGVAYLGRPGLAEFDPVEGGEVVASGKDDTKPFDLPVARAEIVEDKDVLEYRRPAADVHLDGGGAERRSLGRVRVPGNEIPDDQRLPVVVSGGAIPAVSTPGSLPRSTRARGGLPAAFLLAFGNRPAT
jgi:hypothetical protein